MMIKGNEMVEMSLIESKRVDVWYRTANQNLTIFFLELFLVWGEIVHWSLRKFTLDVHTKKWPTLDSLSDSKVLLQQRAKYTQFLYVVNQLKWHFIWEWWWWFIKFDGLMHKTPYDCYTLTHLTSNVIEMKWSSMHSIIVLWYYEWNRIGWWTLTVMCGWPLFRLSGIEQFSWPFTHTNTNIESSQFEYSERKTKGADNDCVVCVERRDTHENKSKKKRRKEEKKTCAD